VETAFERRANLAAGGLSAAAQPQQSLSVFSANLFLYSLKTVPRRSLSLIASKFRNEAISLIFPELLPPRALFILSKFAQRKYFSAQALPEKPFSGYSPAV
jgi:hypothetical protein